VEEALPLEADAGTLVVSGGDQTLHLQYEMCQLRRLWAGLAIQGVDFFFEFADV
jgi:hypothetical protein